MVFLPTKLPAVSSTSSLSSLPSSRCSKPRSDESAAIAGASNWPPSPSTSAVAVVVDPYSTGTVICGEFVRRGCEVVAVWTVGFLECTDVEAHLPQALGGKPVEYRAHVHQTPQDTLETVARRVRDSLRPGQSVACCLAGDEFGVEYADQLSEHLGLESSNGATRIPNRRNKQAQQELIKKAGLRSIRQAGGTSLEDPAVAKFLETERYPIVVKPNESAGSEGVKLCRTPNEAREHFEELGRAVLMDGRKCGGVLCQEFLTGTEYVVDHVSLRGRHVTTAVWAYDKRPANGSAFVYFGLRPVDADSPEAQILIPYVRQVLDAMEIRHGPSHGEVMLSAEGEPCLVEVNCRAHGGNGNWRALSCALNGGYSQVEATIDAYLDPLRFEKLPDRPGPYQASGQEVILVSYQSGTVRDAPGYGIIRSLPSFVCLETSIRVGSEVQPSTDLETAAGSVMLMHPDPQVVQRDVDRIRNLETSHGLFVLHDNLAMEDQAAIQSELQLQRDAKPIVQGRACHLTLESDWDIRVSKNSIDSTSLADSVSSRLASFSAPSSSSRGVASSRDPHHHTITFRSTRLGASRLPKLTSGAIA